MTDADSIHLRAAVGWLELGNWAEANTELERIEARERGCGEVLGVRLRIYAAAGHWETALMLGKTLAASPAADAETLLAAARAASQTGNPDLAREWLTRAVNLEPGREFKLRVLDDPALARFWEAGT